MENKEVIEELKDYLMDGSMKGLPLVRAIKQAIEIVGENKTLKDQYQAIWRELEKTTKDYYGLRNALNNFQLPKERELFGIDQTTEAGQKHCWRIDGFNQALKEITEKLEELKKGVTNGE